MDPRVAYLVSLRGFALIAKIDEATLKIDAPHFGEPADAVPRIARAVVDYLHPDGITMIDKLMCRPTTPALVAEINAALVSYERRRCEERAGRELWQVVAAYLGVDWRTVPGIQPGAAPGGIPGISIQ